MSNAGRAALIAALWMGLASPAAAAEYHVEAAAPCPGSGTALSPFCAIGSAAAIAAPGDTVKVAAGIYREQVTPAGSGAAGLPITYRGAPGARILGTNNLSGTGLWTLASGTTWAAPYDPPTNPQQVFVNDVALTQSFDGATEVPVKSFFYDAAAAVLYVNLGGANPRWSRIEAGARSFGFDVNGRSHLVIEGFEVRGHNTNGIRVRSSAHVVVRGNRVRHAASFGLVADGTTAPTTTGPVEISRNELLENGDAGLRLRTNVVQAPWLPDQRNQRERDRGEPALRQCEAGRHLHHGPADPGLGRQPHRAQPRLRQPGLGLPGERRGRREPAHAQHQLRERRPRLRRARVRRPAAGLEHGLGERQRWLLDRGRRQQRLPRNNIGSDNGLLTGGNDLWVDATSTAGFSSDYDVFHRSSSAGYTIAYGGAAFATVADFAAATGHEVHGSGGNPNFANPGAGDFHPGSGPALDSADASAAGFLALDFAGQPPLDVLSVANTGAGVPDFADRGALERRDARPLARLRVSPLLARVGQLVTANASGSSDDLGIASYRFEFGDGTVVTQRGPIASHAYARGGLYVVRVRVTDTAGQQTSATGFVLVY